MTFTYENQGTSTFLVYNVRPGDEIDTMSLGMLTNNRIDGIAPTQFSQMDTDKYIKYNVSAKVSAEQLLSGPVNKKRLLGVFNGIIDAMLSAEDYMLDSNSLLLDLEYIFVDVSTCETSVICLPLMNSDRKNPDLGTFFKNIIFGTQFDQTENCDHIAKILNYLNGTPAVGLHDFKKVLEQIEKPASAPDAKTSSITDPPRDPAPTRSNQTNNQPTVPANKVSNVAPAAGAAAQVVNSSPAKTDSAPKQLAQQGQNRMAVPGTGSAANIARVPQSTPTSKAAPATTLGKEISWFYLMQHYNAENAALYKAQQEAKKASKGKKKPEPAKDATLAKKQPVAATYAVPGQETTQPAQHTDVPPHHTVTQQSVVEQPQQQIQQHQTVLQTNPQSVASINFGETTVLSAATYGETTVLTGASEPAKSNPFLIRTKNNERIPLNKPVFRIGKERSYVDYFVSDNTAISRGHANIVNHNGELFVVDTNSTNHTYVNGAMISSNVETKLSHGDKIRLANEDFEFRMY